MNYIQQAYKGENKVWMFIITAGLVAGIFIFNLIFFLFYGDEIDVVEQQKALMELIPSKNFWLAANLFLFVPLLGLLFLLVKFMHRRSLVSLTTARNKIDWSRVAFSFFLIVGITVVTFAMSYAMDSSEIELQFDPVKFSILLIISLILFPIQIGLEEYLFRGYLMQHIGTFAKNSWFPILVTSVLFGIFHGANPEIAEIGYVVMVFYIGTGLLLGITTLMDNGLELALGFHFGNNLMAAILVTANWSALQTDAIFRYTGDEPPSAFLEIIVPVLVVYPILLIIFAKKYNWTNWRQKLFGRIEEPKEVDYKILE